MAALCCVSCESALYHLTTLHTFDQIIFAFQMSEHLEPRSRIISVMKMNIERDISAPIFDHFNCRTAHCHHPTFMLMAMMVSKGRPIKTFFNEMCSILLMLNLCLHDW